MPRSWDARRQRRFPTGATCGAPARDARPDVVTGGDPEDRGRGDVRRRQLVALLDALPLIVYAKDAEGRFVLANREAHEAYGFAPGEMVGRLQQESHVRGASNERWRRLDRQVLETGERRDSPATPFVRADGSERIVDFIKVRWLDEGSDAPVVLVIGIDVTERDRMETALRQQERLATLGQMTTSISHELRNPLSTMRASVDVLRRLVGTDDRRVLDALERIDRNISRCVRLIEGPLDFTRMRALEREHLDLNRWLAGVLADLGRPAGLALEEAYAPGPLDAWIDPERMRQAIVNVWENACQALADPADGMRPDARARDGARISVATGVQGGRVEIVVHDNGPGVAEEEMKRVFEPLFSTKGFGTGLGLPIVRQILEQHGGGALMRSRPGVGTTVVLWFPAGRTGTSAST